MPMYAEDTEFLDHDGDSKDELSRRVRQIGTARLLSFKEHVLPGQLLITELWFEVPKDYDNPDGPKLQLFGRSVNKYENPIVSPSDAEERSASQRPWFVYLEGGPGYGNREPQDVALTRYALGRGYQLLYLDYRGTGLSTPVTADTLELQGGPRQQAEYLTFFRADNIVRDLEAVRRCLLADYPSEKQSWTIFGQSFGGFVALTYLSKFMHALQDVFITGGLAPIGKTPEEVYRATWQRVLERNRAYYGKYPEDIPRVHELVRHIEAKGSIPLPAGGQLTARRFLGIGLSFGSHGGLDQVHSLVLRLHADLQQFGFFTRASLSAFEPFVALDTHPIYALLHEAIYCGKGVASNWAADRVGKELAQYTWLADETQPASSIAKPASHGASAPPLFFSGEMIFPFHFETYPELARLKETADILAKFDGWTDNLYDEEALGRNTVPVYAASYVDDMYVDFELARETAKKVKGIKVYETNSLYHNAVRSRPEEVLAHLFRLREDVLD